jgi:release factor glutamine methyltransferase
VTIEEAIIYGKKFLHTSMVKMLISRVTGIDTLDQLNNLNYKFNDKEEKEFKGLIDAVKNNKPIQYVLGSVNFYGLELKVNENVLIPRFETEELVENTIKLINTKFKDKNLDILDLCTGSGAIGLRLKKEYPNSNITLSDISAKALMIASENSEKLELPVKIINSDLFDKIDNKFDVIISNPPYIRDDEEIEDIVRDNEPHIALFAGKDGLDFYDRILKDIKNYLKEEFVIAFEIGADQKQSVSNLAYKYLENIEVYSKQDMSGKDRMIFIVNKSS